jgi:hypothetical protein
MTIFVTEINGHGIFAFSQLTVDVAWALADDKDFRADLMFLLGEDGRPLWDGHAEIYVREADPEEAERWNASFTETRQDGDAEDAEDWAIYLVQVTGHALLHRSS